MCKQKRKENKTLSFVLLPCHAFAAVYIELEKETTQDVREEQREQFDCYGQHTRDCRSSGRGAAEIAAIGGIC